MTKNLKVILFLLILLAAIVLQVASLEKHDLFGDEASAIYSSQKDLKTIWDEGYTYDFRPPLYNTLMHFWFKVFAINEFNLRIFSVICGMLALFAAIKLALFLFTPAVALISAFLIATSPLLILFNRTGRWYSLMSLINMLGIYLFAKAVTNNRFRHWAFYAAVTIMGCYNHYVAFPVILGQGIFLLFFNSGKSRVLRNWLISQAVIFLFYLPWLNIFFTHIFQSIVFPYNVAINTNAEVLNYLGKILYVSFSFLFGQTIYPWNFFVTLPGAIFILALPSFCLFGILGRGNKNQWIFCLIIILLTTVLAQAVTNFSQPHYLMSSCILFFIIISWILANSTRKLAALILSGFLIINAYSVYNLYADRQYLRRELTDSWKKVVDFMGPSYEKDALVLYSNLSFRYYYEKRNKNAGILINYKNISDAAKIKGYLAGPEIKQIWFIDTPLSIDRPDIDKWRKIFSGMGYSLKNSADFNQDDAAELKRKIIKRPFLRSRTSAYLFAKKP